MHISLSYMSKQPDFLVASFVGNLPLTAQRLRDVALQTCCKHSCCGTTLLQHFVFFFVFSFFFCYYYYYHHHHYCFFFFFSFFCFAGSPPAGRFSIDKSKYNNVFEKRKKKSGQYNMRMKNEFASIVGNNVFLITIYHTWM